MTAQDLLRPPAKYKLTVADYLALDERGAFEGLRTELIEGEIIVMSPQTARHILVKTQLGYRLQRALEEMRSTLLVGVDGSVVVGDRSFPEPDIFVADAFPVEGYVRSHSVKLVVEVAATSLDLDLREKVPLYSAAGIPEYWVADVNGRVIHQLWAPAGEAYAERREVAFGDELSSLTLVGLTLSTDGL